MYFIEFLKGVYNSIVTFITEMITGIDSKHMHLWEFEEYVYTRHDIEQDLKILLLVVLGIIIVAIGTKLIDKILDKVYEN